MEWIIFIHTSHSHLGALAEVMNATWPVPCSTVNYQPVCVSGSLVIVLPHQTNATHLISPHFTSSLPISSSLQYFFFPTSSSSHILTPLLFFLSVVILLLFLLFLMLFDSTSLFFHCFCSSSSSHHYFLLLLLFILFLLSLFY